MATVPDGLAVAMSLSSTAAIGRLRRVLDAVKRGGAVSADDREWFAGGVTGYFRHAADGLSLDVALGLAPLQGEAAWWTLERRDRRNRAICMLAHELMPGASLKAQARELTRRLNRYATTRWRNVDSYLDMPPAEYGAGPDQYLYEIMKCGGLPKYRRLSSILAEGISCNSQADPIARRSA